MNDGAGGQERAFPRPELLAPAGDLTCARAAVENGADAVYFGLTEHNARARAHNFSLEETADLVALLHERGACAYAAVNTLVFPGELAGVEKLLRDIAAVGVDAVIVQDVGVARLARALCPDLALHASTQMTLTSAESIAVAEALGVERVILARELSLAEIDRIRTKTRMPLEVFVHGALCVAYSGQCLTSEALGGRSANRGECAQACRLPYELVCDGRTRDLGEVRYLLSPRDLAAFEVVPELVRRGVRSLKIEGRLKTPEYVANITRHYRTAIDRALEGLSARFSSQDVREMELSFSRGFSTGWLHGNNHKVLVEGRNPRKRGVFLGDVVELRPGRAAVRLAGPVKRGDGVVFDRGEPEEPEQGGRVFEVFRSGKSLTEPVSEGIVELAFAGGAIDWRRVRPGDRVWQTDDPELTRKLRKTFEGPAARRRVRLDLRVRARVGHPLSLEATAENGARASLTTARPLEKAEKHPLTLDVLRDQLGRLGKTVYELGELAADLEGAPMAPLSVLGALRRSLVEQLAASLRAPRTRRVAAGSALETLRETIPPRTSVPEAPQLVVLCRSLGQLEEVLAEGIGDVYVDFQDIREYGDATRLARQSGARILLATPRIQKPAEGPLFRRLLRHGADGVLARNLGALAYFTQHGDGTVVADFSLNASNELSVQFLKERGADRVTPSFDLDRTQLMELAAAAPAHWLEVVLHQHMPMFHMEHCVFCAFLSPGTDKTNCGRPCDHHEVKLRDRVGMEHPLKADVGCRNTLFNAVPQSAAEAAHDLLNAGVRHFRVELLDDRGPRVRELIGLYRRLLGGEVSGREVWTRLNARDRVGVTRGPLEVI